MLPTLIASIITFILITVSIILFPNIKVKKVNIQTYWIIALIGAIILLAFSFAPMNKVFSQLTNNSSVNPLKIIVLFFSMTFLSIFLDGVGFFKYLAVLAARRAKNNQFILFLILYGLVSLLTIFTSNDVVILTFTPFICFFCKKTKVNPIPYLISEFVAANTWSLMFVIGNPTNIYLATSANIDFFSYFKVMAIPTLIGGLLELGILLLLFYKQLKTPITLSDEDYKIKNKFSLILGLIHLLVCLIFLVISSYINFEMWIIAFTSALSLLLISTFSSFKNKENFKVISGSLKNLPYQLIPFFLSMFVIVVGLNEQGITAHFASFLGKNHTIWVYGSTSFLASNIINNIPMSILYSDLCLNLTGSAYYQAIYSSIIGSNIGAFLTPIGALAGIMFTNLVKQHDVDFKFTDFIKYGVIISIPVLGITLLTLTFIL